MPRKASARKTSTSAGKTTTKSATAKKTTTKKEAAAPAAPEAPVKEYNKQGHLVNRIKEPAADYSGAKLTPSDTGGITRLEGKPPEEYSGHVVQGGGGGVPLTGEGNPIPAAKT